MSKLIFFVDDDKMIINLLEYTFHSRENFSVRSFASGEECLDAMDEKPDLVVLDHNLASDGDDRMNGIETLEMLKIARPDLPVIILTGFGSKELLEEFTNKGAARFLTKDDYFIDSLMLAIQDVLGSF